MPESILEIAEDAVAHEGFDLVGKDFAEPAVHCRARGLAGLEQKRQIEQADLGHTVREIAGGLVPQRQHATLDQPEDVLGLVAEIHDVPDVADLDAVPERRFHVIADQLEGAAERGRGRAIAAQADLDRSARHCGSTGCWASGARG